MSTNNQYDKNNSSSVQRLLQRQIIQFNTVQRWDRGEREPFRWWHLEQEEYPLKHWKQCLLSEHLYRRIQRPVSTLPPNISSSELQLASLRCASNRLSLKFCGTKEFLNIKLKLNYKYESFIYANRLHWSINWCKLAGGPERDGPLTIFCQKIVYTYLVCMNRDIDMW